MKRLPISIIILMSFLTVSMSFRGRVAVESSHGAQLYQADQATPTTSPTTLDLSPTPVGVQTNFINHTITLNDIGYSKDETLKGVLSSRNYGVYWPDAWLATDSGSFTLRFSHSKALDPHSSVTIDWNGTRLSSALLIAENADHNVLTVEIPKGLIATGINLLHIEFYMGISENFCTDLDNPAVWATISNTSSFNFIHENKNVEPNLKNYPIPFVDNSPLIKNIVILVVPDSPTTVELNALAVISVKLGQLAAWRPLTLSVIPFSQLKLDIGQGNVILVGSIESIKGFDLRVLPPIIKESITLILTDQSGKPLPANAGVLWEAQIPNDPTALILVVTGMNDQAVLKAAQALASGPTYSRLEGQLGVVLQVSAPNGSERIASQSFTLSQLGYADFTGKGTREQSIDYIIPSPLGVQYNTPAKFDLHFSHSELLNTKGSSLNILLNDVPVSSILLSAENTKDGRVTVDIPGRLFHLGDNKLTLAATIQLDPNYIHTGDCLYDYINEAWVVAYADSQISIPFEAGIQQISLLAYPKAFLGKADLTDLVFVAPENATIADAQVIASIANRLGRYTSNDTLVPKVVTQMDINIEQKSPYVFLIGLPARSKAFEKINELLPLPFKTGTNEPEDVNDVAQILPPQGSIGFIEATVDNNGMPMLIVTGNDEVGLRWAGNALGDPLLMTKLKDNLVILDGADSIQTSNIQPKKVNPIVQVAATNPLPEITNQMPNWVIWVACLLLGTTGIVLVAVTIREFIQRRKGRG